METMSPLHESVAEIFKRTVFSAGASAKLNGTVAEADMEDRAPLVYGVTIILWLLALFTVLTRFYARTFITRFRGQDDWWVIAACVFAAGDETLKIIWLQNGLGKHFAYVNLDQFAVFAKVGYTIAVMYPWSLGIVKVSVLTFYLRLFPYETFRKCCYAMMAFVMSITVASSLAQIFSCSPISSSWNLVAVGHCVNKAALQYSSSVLNLVTDIVILLMPMKYLFAMTLDKKRRYSTIALFSLGVLTCVASILRLLTVHLFYTGSDPTWDATDIAIWSGVEINLALITASLPAAKPVFVKLILNPIYKLLGKDPIRSNTTRSTKSYEFSTYTTTAVGSDTVQGSSNGGRDMYDLEAAMNDDEDDSLSREDRRMDFYAMLRADNEAPTGGVGKQVE